MIAKRWVSKEEQVELWRLTENIRRGRDRVDRNNIPVHRTTLLVEDRSPHNRHLHRRRNKTQSKSHSRVSKEGHGIHIVRRRNIHERLAHSVPVNFLRRTTGLSNGENSVQDTALEWRRQELGWSGAITSVLGIRKPIRVEDGLPEGLEEEDSQSSLSDSN